MLDWNLVESAINKEKIFLEGNILPSPFDQNNPIKCSNCLWRLLAILIVSGRVTVKKIIYDRHKIWGDYHKTNSTNKFKEHGTAWHNSLINRIADYFEKQGFQFIKEPQLFFGRADLGINELHLFFEVGTVDLYKLYLNLINIGHNKIILAPTDDYLLEFYDAKY